LEYKQDQEYSQWYQVLMCRDVFSNVVEVLSVSVVISLILLDEKDKDGDEVYEKEMWSSSNTIILL